jgi:hypothetical protein
MLVYEFMHSGTLKEHLHGMSVASVSLLIIGLFNINVTLVLPLPEEEDYITYLFYRIGSHRKSSELAPTS